MEIAYEGYVYEVLYGILCVRHQFHVHRSAHLDPESRKERILKTPLREQRDKLNQIFGGN